MERTRITCNWCWQGYLNFLLRFNYHLKINSNQSNVVYLLCFFVKCNSQTLVILGYEVQDHYIANQKKLYMQLFVYMFGLVNCSHSFHED